MLYQFYEWNHAALAPMRAVADATRALYQNPLNPASGTGMGRAVAAMAELFERTTRVYAKPEFGLDETVIEGRRVPVADRTVWQKPFCRLLHFERALPEGSRSDPRILVVAPMSGHYATLLRGTVEALLPSAEVYITDWTDARLVPVSEGRFDLDDYVDHLIEILQFLGPDTHVVGVCQPAVPVLIATAVMEEREDPCAPATMTLMGGPIDTRINPTAVNRLAEDRGIGWFRDNVIMKVPFPQPGFLREVYPGFLQLTGFMSMNLDRHLISHNDFFWHLVKGDGDSAERHRTFYDEYNAVMDLTAEFYLQTVEEVFIRHSLPKGEITHRGVRVDASKIRRTALLTVEGENDDISGLGQTEAAHRLCSSIPQDMRVHYVQKGVGHYGVFNGSRFRAEVAPRIIDFALTHGRRAEPERKPDVADARAFDHLTDKAPTSVGSDSVGSAIALAGLMPATRSGDLFAGAAASGVSASPAGEPEAIRAPVRAPATEAPARKARAPRRKSGPAVTALPPLEQSIADRLSVDDAALRNAPAVIETGETPAGTSSEAPFVLTEPPLGATTGSAGDAPGTPGVSVSPVAIAAEIEEVASAPAEAPAQPLAQSLVEAAKPAPAAPVRTVRPRRDARPMGKARRR